MRCKWFDRLCRFIVRIPTIELTYKFFWSLMYYGLEPTDRTKVVERLMDYVADPEENTPDNTYE